MFDIIVDIDGTIANNKHRSHFVQEKPKNWVKYKSLLNLDLVYWDIIKVLNVLRYAGSRLVLCTGRDEDERDDTEKWLRRNNIDTMFRKMYMRTAKDNRPDYIIKKELLVKIREDGYNPSLVFDDRQSVVDMWRAEGLRCLAVQAGNF